MFSSEPEPESLQWLDEKYQSAALDPRQPLRCSEKASEDEVRDAFRKICVERMQGDWLSQDSLCKKGEMVNWKLAVFSYRRHTKAFMGPPSYGNPVPATLKQISQEFETTPLMDLEPRDILMVLKPARCFGMGYFKSIRACGFLTVALMGWETCYENALAYTVYIFQVDYCMRRSVVKKRFSEFTTFQSDVLKEIHVYPGTPVEDDVLFKFFLGDKYARGTAMALFMTRTHQVYKDRGLYSPRLMEFLDINVIKVHIEEEARIAKMLDSPITPPGTAWEMVDEVWLSRWRRFVMSRGARRYEAPGKITNMRILEFKEKEFDEQDVNDGWIESLGVFVTEVGDWLPGKSGGFVMKWPGLEVGPDRFDKLSKLGKHEPRAGLKQGRDYRAINSNFYDYLQMAYGGGPRITRKDKTIYSQRACSKMQAVIIVQRLYRMRLGRLQYNKLQNRYISGKLEGVRTVMYQKKEEILAAKARKEQEAVKETRDLDYLNEAATFTQITWRNKKGITASNDGLKIIKEAQEIHANVEGGVEQPYEGEPLVVEDMKDIVANPVTEIDEIVFTEAQGLAVGLSMHPANGSTVVTQLRNDTRDYLPAKPKKLQVKQVNKAREELESLPLMYLESELLSINDYPTRANTHMQVVKRLQHASWPVRLKLRRPLFEEEITPLHKLEDLKNASVRLQAFKRLLIYGAKLNLHKKGVKIDSRLWLTPTLVNWRDEKLCSPYLKKEYSDPKFNHEQEFSKFLSANGLKHLASKLTEEYDDGAGGTVTKAMTLERLLEFNGQSVIKGNYRYPFTYDEVQINDPSDHEKLFKATSKWLAGTVSANLSTQASRGLYDILFVRPGKNGLTGFHKSSKDMHCFSLHFDVPRHTIRVGEKTKAPCPGYVSNVLDTEIVITTLSGKTVKKSIEKAMKCLVIERSTEKTTLQFEVKPFPVPDEYIVTGKEDNVFEAEEKERKKKEWEESDDKRRKAARDICVTGWKKIIEEVRNSQYIIDKAGIPKRRHEPPVVLSMME